METGKNLMPRKTQRASQKLPVSNNLWILPSFSSAIVFSSFRSGETIKALS
jgi:hypothetical protein